MKTKGVYLGLFLLLAVILTACGASAPTSQAATVQSFWDALNAKNVDTAMAFVADDVKISGGPFVMTTNGITFSIFMASETKRGVTFETSDVKAISDDTVTFNQTVHDNNGAVLANGQGTFQFNKDGKIILMKLP